MAKRSVQSSKEPPHIFFRRYGKILGIVVSIMTILSLGFGIGVYVTNTQYENKITNINIENQRKMSEEREKGRKEGIEEMKQEEEQLKKYLILFKKNEQNEDKN